MLDYGIEQLLSSCLAFFRVIYVGGVYVFNWFSTPIEPTGDELVDVLLESFVGMTPFELSFGVAMSSILFLALIRFLRGIIS